MMLTLEVNFADIENCTTGHDEEQDIEEELINCFNSVSLDKNFIELDTNASYVILDIVQDIYGDFNLYISNSGNLVLKFKIISENFPVIQTLQGIKFKEYARVYRDTYHVIAEI